MTFTPSAEQLSRVVADLEALIRIPSIAFPGFDQHPVHDCAALVKSQLAKRTGVDVTVRERDGAAPILFATLQAADPQAPTVLLYAHYDVQPVPPGQDWTSDPWEPTLRNGRIFGRGSADDKSGIAIILGVLDSLGGDSPVNLKIVIEGEEEYGSEFISKDVAENPTDYAADVMLFFDNGNISPTEPAIAASLRGFSACNVTLSTLTHASHSGAFGGAAPDALLAMIQLLGTLHHPDGSLAVEGLQQITWPDDEATVDENAFRAQAGVLPGVDLVGKGSLVDRLWCRPSVTVLGIDAPDTSAPNSLVDTVTAKVSLRVAPGADPAEEMRTLIAFLESRVPWHAKATFEPINDGAGHFSEVDHPAMTIALGALEQAYGTKPRLVGSGGSVPLVAELAQTSPGSLAVLWGAEDLAHARIHAADESVDPQEIARIWQATLDFLVRYAAYAKGTATR